MRSLTAHFSHHIRTIDRFVAEMMANRVLRFFQQPTGVFHASVFHQLSGGVGPSCLTLDAAGNLYVGQYDVKGEFMLLLFMVRLW